MQGVEDSPPALSSATFKVMPLESGHASLLIKVKDNFRNLFMMVASSLCSTALYNHCSGPYSDRHRPLLLHLRNWIACVEEEQ